MILLVRGNVSEAIPGYWRWTIASTILSYFGRRAISMEMTKLVTLGLPRKTGALVKCSLDVLSCNSREMCLALFLAFTQTTLS
jgi:hypothetical protein